MTNVLLIVLSKIVVFCFWFIIGVSIYSSLLKGDSRFKSTLKSYIDRLSFMELVVIFFTVFYLVNFIITLSLNYFVNVDLLLLNSEHRFMVMNEEVANQISSNSNTNPTNQISSKSNTSPTNSGQGIGLLPAAIAVGGVGMVAGMKAAASSPSIGGKLACVAGGILAGGASIVTSSISQKIGEEIVKPSASKLIDSSLLEPLRESLHLTGNSGIDLIILIHNFHKFQLLFLFIITYNLILISINEEKVEMILLKILPVRIVNFISKFIKAAKKYGKTTIICAFIFLVLCNIQSYYYLNFYLENLDGIIETYLKK